MQTRTSPGYDPEILSPSRQVATSLRRESIARLNELATAKGISVSAYIRQIVENTLATEK